MGASMEPRLAHATQSCTTPTLEGTANVGGGNIVSNQHNDGERIVSDVKGLRLRGEGVATDEQYMRQRESPQQMFQQQQLLRKQQALKAAREAYARTTKEEHVNSVDPFVLVKEAERTLEWPTGIQYLNHEERAIEFMQEWELTVADKLLDGSNHMRHAIDMVVGKLQPKQLQNMVMRAMRSGKLVGGNQSRRVNFLLKIQMTLTTAAL